MSLELVKWRDAHFDVDKRRATRKDYVVKTVGWVKEGPVFLRIISERTPDGARAVTYVPNENVLERRPLS
jgi:hypothetical protein